MTVPSPLPPVEGQNGADVAVEGTVVSANGAGAIPPPDAVIVAVNATPPDTGGADLMPNDGISGMSALRGLMVYGAILTFAGLYGYFIVVISNSPTGVKPAIDATLISAAAALSGVLGAAFALKTGVAHNPALVNHSLALHVAKAKLGERSRASATVRSALSLEPGDQYSKSWPLTIGIWAYGGVASAVFVAYVLNQDETPGTVKALAVTFGGYVIALINTAYGMGKPTAA